MISFCANIISKYMWPLSSVVEQPAVNRLVGGSSPLVAAIVWPVGEET